MQKEAEERARIEQEKLAKREEEERLRAEALERIAAGDDDVDVELDVDNMLTEHMGDADMGLGVFSALHHVSDEDNELVKKAKLREFLKQQMKQRKEARRKAEAIMRQMKEWENKDKEEEEEEEEPVYMKGRKVLSEELEVSELPGTPFDRYELSLGSKVRAAQTC